MITAVRSIVDDMTICCGNVLRRLMSFTGLMVVLFSSVILVVNDGMMRVMGVGACLGCGSRRW